MRRPGFEMRFTPSIAERPASSYLSAMSMVFRTFLPFFSMDFKKPASRSFSAIAILKAENGTETDAFFMAVAFARRTMKSPTGSPTIKQVSGYRCQVSAYYQELFFIPGILPSKASSRKQMRHRLKSRIKPRGRPHLKQRRTIRDLNFGVRCAFTIIDFLAIGKASRNGAKAWHPPLAREDYGHFVRDRYLLPTCG